MRRAVLPALVLAGSVGGCNAVLGIDAVAGVARDAGPDGPAVVAERDAAATALDAAAAVAPPRKACGEERPCVPEVMASDQVNPVGIAGTGGEVYWMRHGTTWTPESGLEIALLRAPVDAAEPPVTVQRMSEPDLMMEADAIRARAGRLTWSVAGRLHTCALPGCDRTEDVGPVSGQIFDADGDGVMFLDGRVLRSCPWSTGCAFAPPSVRVAEVNTTIREVALAGSDVVFLEGDHVRACPRAGCDAPAIDLATSPKARTLVATSADVYWSRPTAAYTSQVMRCALPSCGDGPETIGGAQGTVGAIAVDEAFVYWTSPGDGTVRRCERPRCTRPVVIASEQASPWSIASVGTRLFWLNRGDGGALVRMDK